MLHSAKHLRRSRRGTISSEVKIFPYLPPEVFEAIFKLCSKKTLKKASRVCRSWNLLTKGLLFSEVKITRVKAMKGLEKSARLHTSVRSLRVDVPEGRTCWTVKGLVALIQKLEKLQSLSVNLNEGSPGAFADFRTFTSELNLPKLTHLELLSDKYDGNQQANQQFLQSTPNIRSLTIKTTESRDTWDDTDAPHTPGSLHLVNLPLLTHLHLGGNLVVVNFLENQILDEATLDQITSFGISPCTYVFYPVPPMILYRLQTQISSLKMVDLEIDDNVYVEGLDIGMLVKLKTLTLTGCGMTYGPVPPSVSHLIIDGPTTRYNRTDLSAYNWNSVNVGNVKTIEFRNIYKEYKSSFAWLATRMNREIIADGVTYRPHEGAEELENSEDSEDLQDD